MITWLASYPRSGNTLFRVAVSRLFGMPSYSVYNDSIFAERPDVANVVGHQNFDESLESLRDSLEAYLVKTHDLPGQDAYPAIYLVRDGRDVLVSYAHFALDFERSSQADDADFETVLRNLIVSRDAFGGWGPNVAAWSRRTAPTVIVKFEQLIASPERVVEESLAALSLPIRVAKHARAAALPTFAELKQRMPEFFRRGTTGGWRDEMSPGLEQLFWEHHGDVMVAMGYSRG
jgi:Sulfotransferase domain